MGLAISGTPTTDETKDLINRDNLALGISIHLATVGVAKMLQSDGESWPQYVVRRCDVRPEHFKGAFQESTIYGKIMPYVAEEVAQAYGIPLWNRWSYNKDHYARKYGVSDEHYEILSYLSPERTGRIRNIMDWSYNNSSEVLKNPLLRQDISKLEPVHHVIDVPQDVVDAMNAGPSSVLQQVDL